MSAPLDSSPHPRRPSQPATGDFPPQRVRSGRHLQSAADGSATAGTLALLRHDPDLRGAIPPSDLAHADRAIVTPALRLADGPWSPPEDALASGLPILVTGTLLQHTRLTDRSSVQLVGPGAILHDVAGHDASLPCELSWTSIDTSMVALLDQRFAEAARHWPALWQVIHRRIVDQLKTAARWNAATSLPRIEDRVLAVFWLIADACGVRRADGVAIRLALTHECIGRMTAARRPTVSLALASLAEHGHLTRIDHDEWLLSSTSPREIGRPGTDRPQRSISTPAGAGS